MDITIKRRNTTTPAAAPRKIAPASPFDRRIGEWGKVEASHSEDNTVDVYLASGVYLNRVPVASKEWVISGSDIEKDYNAGERNLPPRCARVFVVMPTFNFDDCFIAPFSGFSTIDQTKPYMDSGKEKIREQITPSGWHITDDYTTGSHKVVSPDEKTILEIDYGAEDAPKNDAPELRLSLFDEIKLEHIKGDSCSLKVFDTELVIKEGEVSIKPKKTTIEVDGDATVKVGGSLAIQTENTPIEIKSGGNSLGALIGELLNGLMALHTEGSAASHVAAVWAAEKITPLLTKWKQAFKE